MKKLKDGTLTFEVSIVVKDGEIDHTWYSENQDIELNFRTEGSKVIIEVDASQIDGYEPASLIFGMED